MGRKPVAWLPGLFASCPFVPWLAGFSSTVWGRGGIVWVRAGGDFQIVGEPVPVDIVVEVVGYAVLIEVLEDVDHPEGKLSDKGIIVLVQGRDPYQKGCIGLVVQLGRRHQRAVRMDREEAVVGRSLTPTSGEAQDGVGIGVGRVEIPDHRSVRGVLGDARRPVEIESERGTVAEGVGILGVAPEGDLLTIQ